MHLAPVVGWRRAAKAITRVPFLTVSASFCQVAAGIPVLQDDCRPLSVGFNGEVEGARPDNARKRVRAKHLVSVMITMITCVRTMMVAGPPDERYRSFGLP